MINEKIPYISALDYLDQSLRFILRKMKEGNFHKEASFIQQSILSRSELFRFLPKGVFTVVGNFMKKMMIDKFLPLELEECFNDFLIIIGFHEQEILLEELSPLRVADTSS
ncbi:MAG: hypothetical protein ACTSYA_01030 [Candidatus Kariarchaeaceae archaeon]